MDIYLSVTAGDYPKAAAYGNRFAFVAYGIGPDGTLTRGNLPILPAPSQTVWTFPAAPSSREAARETYRRDAPSFQREPPPVRRNLLSLSDRDAPGVENPEVLCGYVCRECARRGYAGAVLDFEGAVREDLRSFAACLARRFADTGRRLYLPEPYAAAVPDRTVPSAPGNAVPDTAHGTADAAGRNTVPDAAAVLLCTAVSGGNFEEHLRETVERRGADRTALDVQRLRMDFTLPAPSGEGVPLDASAFRELAKGKAVYFSPDLCARYFTFTEGSIAHFVLFDDADTLNRKLDLGRRYGVRAALLQWPEISDIAGELRLS